jgi:vancomycin resistance protein YoaR
MTTQNEPLVPVAPALESVTPIDAPLLGARRRVSARLRFVIAFIVGLLAVLAVGTAGIYAYDQQYADRILPGVRVGTVDVSGLDRAAAAERLGGAFASASDGAIVIHSSVAELRVPYADFGRRADIGAMVDAALAVGHGGALIDRALAEARTALRGATVEPQITFDGGRLLTSLQAKLATLEITPASATVSSSGRSFVATPAVVGRAVDLTAVVQAVKADLGRADAPAQITVDAQVSQLAPGVDDAAAGAAAAAANRMVASDLKVTDGTTSWTIKAATIHTWISFGATPSGAYGPLVDQARVQAAVKGLAKQVNRAPVNASFLVSKSGSIVGVTAASNGRTLDVPATSALVASALNARAANGAAAPVTAALAVTTPKLTTDQARKAAPLMTRISTWTTWFPISDHNFFGANIWIPALLINGTVVGPGETFDFWNTVGAVNTARGFGPGGAIVNGHTDPTGAIGGGICSCSTTLFNAALRAGFKMDARTNHYYYIDRYPLGLDATVFISSGGYKTTMSWTNDTQYPVLIRGYKIRGSGRGFVRFDLFSVPTGRRVVIGTPTVKNYVPATTITQYTSTLPKGVTKQVEYPVAGEDVWRTRTVYDASGRVIHQETWYSHYSRVNGLILIGTG